MSLNPYESPSTAGFEDTTRAGMVLDASQQPAVRRFIVLNRMAGLAILGTGSTITLLVPLLWVIEHTAAPVAAAPTVITIAVLALAGIVWGGLQLMRTIGAILFTSAAMVGLFALLVFMLIRDGATGRLPDSFVALGVALALVGWMVYASAWLAVRAWLWRLQGIDLTALEKVEYRPTGGYLAVQPPNPGGSP